jgi:hypothetical protein
MDQKPKRIIIKACILSILAAFMAITGFVRRADAALVMSHISAARAPNERADEAARRSFTASLMNGHFKSVANVSTAYELLKPFNQVDLKNVPEWKNQKVLNDNFLRIRDLRFIDSGDNFQRRLSWLYPDDGCFARADLERSKLEEWRVTAPLKIIVSGDLSVKTSNSLNGTVTWWWHISKLIKVGDDYFVLDPSIEPKRPLTVREWLSTMVADPDTASVAICSPYTYNIYDDCAQTTDQLETAYQDQLHFLELEWERQIELGRDPEKVLGHEPPWAQ